MPIHKYNRIGTCTYCGLKDIRVREASIEHRRGMSLVIICSNSLCELEFQTDPLGFGIFDVKLKHDLIPTDGNEKTNEPN